MKANCGHMTHDVVAFSPLGLLPAPVALPTPDATGWNLVFLALVVPSGFHSVPFEPPRS